LPTLVAQSKSYCWVSLKNGEAPTLEVHKQGVLVLPVALDDVEAVYFTSDSRRREFLADLQVSGFGGDDLPFFKLVWPGELALAQGGQEVHDLQARVQLLDREIAYQERISAAISAAAALVWWREKDLPGLRSQVPPEKYKRLAAWADCAQGVVDSDGRWSRTSVEQSFSLLEAAGFGDQIRMYELHVKQKSWPVAEGSLLATALLMLARTEGGTPETIAIQLLALNGIAMASEYAVSDAMIFIAAALGRHHLPNQWQPRGGASATLVRDEIRHATERFQDLVRLQPSLAAEPGLQLEAAPPISPEKPARKGRKRDQLVSTNDENSASGVVDPNSQLTWSKDELNAHLHMEARPITAVTTEPDPLDSAAPEPEEKI
jgi:hypothetical protein